MTAPREVQIRASCLAADLRDYLDKYSRMNAGEIEQYHKDLDDSLTGLEKWLDRWEDDNGKRP